MDDFSDLIDSIWNYAIAWGLRDEIAIPYTVAAAYDWWENGRWNGITSGFRSLAYQRRLRNRWLAGERTGLTSQPARRSFHTLGLAVDVSDPSDYFASIMAAYGARRIGRNHFQFETGEQPETA